MPGQVGRPFIVKEAELLAHLEAVLGPVAAGMPLSELSRRLSARTPAEMSPSALFARLKRLVAAELLLKDGLNYRLPRRPSPAVEVD